MNTLRSRNGKLLKTPSGKLATCGSADPCSAWINPPEHNPTVMFSINGITWNYSDCFNIMTEQDACIYELAGDYSGFDKGEPPGICNWWWGSDFQEFGRPIFRIKFDGQTWYASHEIDGYPYYVTGYGFTDFPVALPEGSMSIIDGKLSGAFTLNGLCGRGNTWCTVARTDQQGAFPYTNSFSDWLWHTPIMNGTVHIEANAVDENNNWYGWTMTDDGSGHLVANEIVNGTIDYNTGQYGFTLANPTAMILQVWNISYLSYETWNQFPFSMGVTIHQE